MFTHTPKNSKYYYYQYTYSNIILLCFTSMSFCYEVEKLSFNRFLYRSIVQI